jgi:hypothetical protein
MISTNSAYALVMLAIFRFIETAVLSVAPRITKARLMKLRVKKIQVMMSQSIISWKPIRIEMATKSERPSTMVAMRL